MHPACNLAAPQTCVRRGLEGEADGLHLLAELDWGGCLQEGNVVDEGDFVKFLVGDDGADVHHSGLL